MAEEKEKTIIEEMKEKIEQRKNKPNLPEIKPLPEIENPKIVPVFIDDEMNRVASMPEDIGERVAREFQNIMKGKMVPEFSEKGLGMDSSPKGSKIDQLKFNENVQEWNMWLDSWKKNISNSKKYQHVNHSDGICILVRFLKNSIFFVGLGGFFSFLFFVHLTVTTGEYHETLARLLIDGYALISGFLFMMERLYDELVEKLLRRSENWDSLGELRVPISEEEFRDMLEGKNILSENKSTKKKKKSLKKRILKEKMREESNKKKKNPVNVIDDWIFERMVSYKDRMISSLSDMLAFYVVFFALSVISPAISYYYFKNNFLSEIMMVIDIISIFFLVEFVSIIVFNKTLSMGSIKQRMHETFCIFLCNHLYNYILNGNEDKKKMIYVKYLVMYLDFYLSDVLGKSIENKDDVMESIRNTFFKGMDEKKVKGLGDILLKLPEKDAFDILDIFCIVLPYTKIDIPRYVKVIGTVLTICYGLFQFVVKSLLE